MAPVSPRPSHIQLFLGKMMERERREKVVGVKKELSSDFSKWISFTLH